MLFLSHGEDASGMVGLIRRGALARVFGIENTRCCDMLCCVESDGAMANRDAARGMPRRCLKIE